MVGDGLKRTIEYVTNNKLKYTVDKRWIEIEVDEKNIANFLANLAAKGVNYTQISIQKPSLEDYFIQLAKGKKNEK